MPKSARRPVGGNWLLLPDHSQPHRESPQWATLLLPFRALNAFSSASLSHEADEADEAVLGLQ